MEPARPPPAIRISVWLIQRCYHAGVEYALKQFDHCWAIVTERRCTETITYEIVFWAGLDVGHQAHETFILVILMMAVQQCWPWIVGDEVDLDRAEPRHIDRVFHHA